MLLLLLLLLVLHLLLLTLLQLCYKTLGIISDYLFLQAARLE